jgi:hypothetical protein
MDQSGGGPAAPLPPSLSFRVYLWAKGGPPARTQGNRMGPEGSLVPRSLINFPVTYSLSCTQGRGSAPDPKEQKGPEGGGTGRRDPREQRREIGPGEGPYPSPLAGKARDRSSLALNFNASNTYNFLILPPPPGGGNLINLPF